MQEFPPIAGIESTTADLSNSPSWAKKNLTYCCALAGVILLAALLLAPWDHPISETLRFSPVLHGRRLIKTAFDWSMIFGKGDVLLMLALAAGACGFKRRAVTILVALVISTMLVWPLKVTIKRERPRGQSMVSFPSGDAAAIAAFSVPLVAGAPFFVPAAGGVVAIVAFGRVFHGAHYPTDVLAGIAVGIIAGALAILLCRNLTLARVRERHFLALIAVLLAGWSILNHFASSSHELVKSMWLLTPLLLARFIVRCRRDRETENMPAGIRQAIQDLPRRDGIHILVAILSAILLLFAAR
jgi:membrane-associated phospholipid phosphatase